MSALPAETTSRARIFDAALTVFSRYGYRRASMEAVAAEANLSRQGLYRHFATKEALFLSMLEAMHDLADAMAAQALDEARAAKKSAAEALGALIAARLEFYAARVLGSPHAAELMEVSNRIGGAIIAARTAAALDTVKQAIAAERTAGRLTLKRGVTPADLAELLTAAANGAKYGALLPPDVLGARVRRIVALMIDGARA